MQETNVKCDFCRKPVPEGESSIEVRIDDKMHDLCKSCSEKLTKLLRGTGRPVEEKQPLQTGQLPVDWQKLLGGQQIDILPPTTVPAVPYTAPYIPYGGQPLQPWNEPNGTVWVSNTSSNTQDAPQSANYMGYVVMDGGIESIAQVNSGLSKAGPDPQAMLLDSIFNVSPNLFVGATPGV